MANTQPTLDARKALEDARRHSAHALRAHREAVSSETLERRIRFAQQILSAGSYGRTDPQ